MKKILLILLGIIIVLFAIVITIPIIYKDEIKAKIDEELAKSINAQVYFEKNKFGISLLTNFPNLALKLGDFGIVGKDAFEGDTLTSIKSFRVVVDLMSVISGDQIKINGIYLINPRIFATVLEDSTASWDIFIAGEEEPGEKEEEEPSDFSIKIKKWEIKNGYIVFDDRTAPMYAEIVNLNHTGSGDFTQDILDLVTNTKIDALTLELGGVKYFNKNTLDIDFIINMDMPNSKYIFKENKIKINDFSFGFDGFIAMNEEDINMDITFKTKETRFKNILSLVPGVFLEGFEDLKTSGSLAFNGFAKGTYNENSLPAFGFKLIVNDGMLQYPDLPTAINNITLDMYVDNKDGILDNTVINIKKFHIDMGNNPIDAKILVEGLTDYKIDADVLAKINLAELTKMIPMEGLTLKGLFSLDIKAKGIYSETQMPS
ncbi:MAG: AsmA family protein, partial [Bacteroidetes bacterium]|nr:AsmA family protein [Bacteroidota bacterium]